MHSPQPSFHIFDNHTKAEAAIRELGKSGFDMKKLSLVGKGYHSEEHPVGFYTVGQQMKTWGSQGAFWGGIWGALFAPAIFLVPGIGLLAMAGPMVTILVSALEGAVVVGGLSALGAALSRMGVPNDRVIEYETALKSDKYVLMVQGTTEDDTHVTELLAKQHQA